MATTKTTKAKKKQLDDIQIVSLYMNDVLEMNEAPKNVLVFARNTI